MYNLKEIKKKICSVEATEFMNKWKGRINNTDGKLVLETEFHYEMGDGYWLFVPVQVILTNSSAFACVTNMKFINTTGAYKIVRALTNTQTLFKTIDVEVEI